MPRIKANDKMSQILQRHEEEISELQKDVQELQDQVLKLNGSVQKALDTLLPKVEALLHDNEEKSMIPSQLPSTSKQESETPSDSSFPDTILEAVESGDRKSLQKLLDAGASIRRRNANGETALHLAAAAGDVESVKILLEAGAAVDVAGNGLDTPLHRAASGGHSSTISVLMEAGAQINTAGPRLETPLHRAVIGGHLQVVRLLLSAGANIKLKDVDGNTPLRIAVENGAADSVFELLQYEKRNANIYLQELAKELYNPLAEIFGGEGLLAYVKNVNTALSFEDAYPGMLKSCIACHALYAASECGNVKAVNALLNVGVGSCDRGHMRYSLNTAVENGNIVCAHLLRKHVANANYGVYINVFLKFVRWKYFSVLVLLTLLYLFL